MLRAARRLTDKPIAVNLLLPFVRGGDAEAASQADALVTFWGPPRRLASNTWIHQCGSVAEAKAAAAAGVDAVIAQGVEAGGHVRGSTAMLELLEQILAAVHVPVLAAELFGLGWPDAPHRVIPNAATQRWARSDRRGPSWVRTMNRLTVPLASRVPSSLQARALSAQRPSRPFLGPQPPTDDGPESLLDAGPLYAGMHVGRITDIRPAAELVRALTP